MDNTIYKNRRNNLKELLPNNSVLLIPGADLQYRNADSAFPFRQDSSFYYLSGFCEPSSLIAIVNNKDGIKSIIFVPPKDKLKEIWDGHRSGPVGAVDDFLFDKAEHFELASETARVALAPKLVLFYSLMVSYFLII